jgi:hypothetical protein
MIRSANQPFGAGIKIWIGEHAALMFSLDAATVGKSLQFFQALSACPE